MLESRGFLSLIPLLSLLFFIGGIIFYWITAFFILYHLIRFGIGTTPKKLSLVFLLTSVIITLIITFLFVQINVGSFTKPLTSF